jgi:hypothetical protein
MIWVALPERTMIGQRALLVAIWASRIFIAVGSTIPGCGP